MKKHLPIALLLLCAAALTAGLAHLFQLRFEAGDVYPAYSSLRADPLGTMGLFESVEKLPGFSAQRDYSTANRLPAGRDTAYLHLAAMTEDWQWLPEETFREIERFLDEGGRLVVTLFPQPSEHSSYFKLDLEADEDRPVKDRPTANDKSGKASPKDEKNEGRKAGDDPLVDEKKPAPARSKPEKKRRGELAQLKHDSMQKRWGVEFGVRELGQDGEGAYEPARVTNQTSLPLPEALDWHSGIVCSNLHAAWQTVYARGTNAVVIERRFGRGSVVIATDSWFLSNEALHQDRQPEVLAWILGPGRTVVFDEAHFGVLESPGMADLMRQYRLHGVVAGLLILAGLFIWKNTASLVPPHEEAGGADWVAGKDAASGFVNLLRRSVAPRDLLAACFAEWKKSVAPSGKYSAARLQQAEAAFQAEQTLGARERNPVRAYQAISKILETRNLEAKPNSQSPGTSQQSAIGNRQSAIT